MDEVLWRNFSSIIRAIIDPLESSKASYLEKNVQTNQMVIANTELKTPNFHGPQINLVKEPEWLFTKFKSNKYCWVGVKKREFSTIITFAH